MRKPRDYDSELCQLNEKVRSLRVRRLQQLGEVVIATGADTLPIEQLAGAMLTAVETKDSAAREAWRKRGAAFFQGTTHRKSGSDYGDGRSAPTSNRGDTSTRSDDRTE